MPLELFPYQEQGAAWLATRERAGLLDEPGAGKTCQVIRALDLRRARRGVVICPASVRENWRGEFTKFSHFSRKICKGHNLHDFVAWSRDVFDVLVLSYDMALRWAPHFERHGELMDFLVLDECQALKNLDSKRARAILGPHGDNVGGLAQWAVQSWMLSGTIMPNDPADIYPLLRYCRATELSREAFARRYFTARPTTWGSRNKPKTDMLPELQRLIANNSIRRTLAEVGIELPPIFLTTCLVDGDTEQVRTLLSGTPGLERSIVDAVAQGGLSFLESQHIATLRRLIAEAKALPYAEMLHEELLADPDRKVVVGGISRAALVSVRDYLAARNVWCVLLHGDTSETARQEAMRAFQSSPKCRVIIVNMDVGGVGVNLTAGDHCDVLESAWTPGKNAQLLKRIRRIGQTRTQHARFITLAGSLDEEVNRIVAEKTAAIALIEGDAMIAAPRAAE